MKGFLWDGTDYQIIEVPGATSTLAAGVNNVGQITLVWYDAVMGHSSIYDGTNYTPIDVPGALDTVAGGINKNGDVAAYWTNTAGIHYGSVLHDGIWHTFSYPGYHQTAAFGINDADVVVGAAEKGPGIIYTGYKLIP